MVIGDKVEKKSKSFNLKKSNADKVERMAFEKKERESHIVDKMIEEFEDGC